MARVLRSPRAKRDIIDVLEYTRDRWGKDQARAYRDLIREALRAISADPGRGNVRGTRPGILSYHIKQPGGMRDTSCSIESMLSGCSSSSGSCMIRWTSISISRNHRATLPLQSLLRRVGSV